MTAKEIRSTGATEAFTGLPALTELQTALLKTGCRILDTDQVRACQAEKLSAEKAKLQRKIWRSKFLGIAAVAVAIWGVSGFLLAFMGRYALALFTLGLAALLVTALVRIIDRLAGPYAYQLSVLGWRTYWIGAGQSCVQGTGVKSVTQIPHNLVNRTEEIARAYPKVVLYVDQLDTDPFLWVAEARNDRGVSRVKLSQCPLSGLVAETLDKPPLVPHPNAVAFTRAAARVQHASSTARQHAGGWR